MTTMYRLFDEEHRLLYIGIAGNPGRRFEQHAKDKPWWSEVAHLALEHFGTRMDAEAAERRAIRTERPAYNVVHNKPTTVTAQPTPERTIPWTCDLCQEPVGADDGIIELPHAELRRYRQEREAWDATHPQKDEGWRIVDVNELLAEPELATWWVIHQTCDPNPDGGGYHFTLDRAQTPEQLLSWTVHLMEKSWINDTTWASLMGRALDLIDARWV